jgi:hypothetical protein
MDDYYERLETQLAVLTERGAHRRTRAVGMIPAALGLVVVVAVGALFLGTRTRQAAAPARPGLPLCSNGEWRLEAPVPGRVNGAVVSGPTVSGIGTPRCALQGVVRFAIQSRGPGGWVDVAAIAGNPALGQTDLYDPLPYGTSTPRDWAWENWCGPSQAFRLLASAVGRSASTPVAPPACVSRSSRSWLAPFAPARGVLNANGIATVGFGRPPGDVMVEGHTLLGRPTKPYAPDPTGCGVDHIIEWPGLSVHFERGRFVGYSFRGSDMTTRRGLRVGNTLARARRLYGRAFKTSVAQGGSWSVETPTGRLIGYLSDVPPRGRIASIEAGNVGCAAVTP